MEQIFSYLNAARNFVVQAMSTTSSQSTNSNQSYSSSSTQVEPTSQTQYEGPPSNQGPNGTPYYQNEGVQAPLNPQALLDERQAVMDELNGLGLSPLDYNPFTQEGRDNIGERFDLYSQLGDLNAEITQNILQGTAPVLILPDGQGNLPANPLDYINESELKEDNGIGGSWPSPLDPLGNRDDSLGNNTDDNPNNNFDPSVLTSLGSNHYLDVNGTEIISIGSEDAPIFYEVDLHGDPPQATYHIFYPYNDGPYVQNHEGDWERVTINLDPVTLEPESVTYSAHGHGSTIPYEDVDKYPGTNQPIVFVADGSHANYAENGPHETNVPSSGSAGAGGVEVGYYDPELQDHTVTDENGDGVYDEQDGAVVIDTSDQLEPVQDQVWYPEEGNEGVKWGEQGNAIANDHGIPGVPGLGSDGPTGPSEDKGHQDIAAD